MDIDKKHTYSECVDLLKDNVVVFEKYEKLMSIGLLTIPVLIGFYIRWHYNKKLQELSERNASILHYLYNETEKEMKKIEQEYDAILEQDTYLICSDKDRFISETNNFIENEKFVVNNVPLIPKEIFDRITQYIERTENMLAQIAIHNDEFVKRRKKKYAELFKRDKLILDDEQQTAVITDDKHNLVVAGAGSGKTEVLITRIAYLIKRKPDTIKPERIFAIAFQSEASNEVGMRLKKYKIRSVVPNDVTPNGFSKSGHVTIGTFHSLGNRILRDASRIKGIRAPKLKQACSNDSQYVKYIKSICKEYENDPELQELIISLMKCYSDAEIKTQEEFLKDGKTKEDFYQYMKNLQYTCLDGEKVRSEAERFIKNFFIMHTLNGEKIKIEYETPAKWMKYITKSGDERTPTPDFFFPDFNIYIEHWAIADNDTEKVPDWFGGENPTERYLEGKRAKRNKFAAQDKYILIETINAEYRKSSSEFEENLKKKFIVALKNKYPDKEFQFKRRSYEELKEIVWDESQGAANNLAENISKYIRIAKTYSLKPEDIKTRLINGKWSIKQKLFAKIAIIVYERYCEELNKEHEIDFQDMINLAVKALKENPKLYKNTYDHILIDEYQDISTQRYELIRELMNKNPKCKLFCVGDDWQSIMGFSGSNLEYFINFGKYFHLGNRAKTDLTKNYRSIKSVVDAGACIIKNNEDGQIRKETISNSDEIRPFLVYSSLHQKDYFMSYYEQIAKHALDKINEYVKNGYAYDDFMILLRIANKPKLRNIITEYAKTLSMPISEEPNKPNHVHIMSVHKSKGLQAKVVIILNVDKGLYGFPCELENPDIFETAIQNNDGFREHEERRLFYVAVTRAKKEVILYTQNCSESKFITEIKDFIVREDLPY